MSGTVTTTLPILVPIAATADAALGPNLAATSAAQIANTSAIAGQAAVLSASASLSAEISHGADAAEQTADKFAVVTNKIGAAIAESLAAAPSNAKQTQTVHEGSLPAVAQPETPHNKIDVVLEGNAPTITAKPATVVPTILLTEAPMASSLVLNGVLIQRNHSEPSAYLPTGRKNPVESTGSFALAQDDRKKNPASIGVFDSQNPAPHQKTDSTPITASPKVMRGARQAHSGNVIGHRISPEKAALGVFEMPRTEPAEKKSQTGRKARAQTRAAERIHARETGHTCPAGTVIGENFVRTLKPNTHVVVRTTLGGVPIFQHFVIRNGELEFAGWEIAASNTNSANALGTPATISWANIEAGRPNIFAFGLPGGETALRQDYIADVNAQIGEELANRILAQIKGGPKSLENSIQLAAFNSFLRGNGYMTPSTRVTAKDWELLVRETLRMSLRHVHAIDENGARSISSIRADAAMVIGINRQTVASWETHFDTNFVDLQLAASDEFGAESARPLNLAQSLVLALEERIGSMAASKIASSKSEFGISMDVETSLAWQAVRLSLIEDSSKKVERARLLLIDIFERSGRNHAATALAMIIWNAALDGEKNSKDAIAPGWSKSDAAALVKALSNGPAWEAVSHRAFRGELSIEANAWINEALASVRAALHDDVLKMDVTQIGTDAFFDALEASGRADEITLAALLKMGLMAAQTHKGAASRESYS